MSDLLPHDKDAEQGVLGSVIHNNLALGQVRGMLKPDCFFSPAHRDIFIAMCSVEDAEGPIDEITIGNVLKAKNRLESAGGLPYIAELVDLAPVTANVLVYAEIVLEKWQARKAVTVLLDGVDSINATGKLNGQAETVRNALDAIEAAGIGSQAAPAADAVERFTGWLEDQDTPAFKAKTYTRLDELLGGIGDERPTVIAGRTGVGKTTLLTQIARDKRPPTRTPYQ